MTATLQFAHISDIHFSKDGNRGFMLSEEASRFLAGSVERLNGNPDIDFLFISGDCLNSGHQTELNRFEQVVALSEKPVLIVPGNHDGNHAIDPFCRQI